ncbi:MAG: pilus assembly protein [Parvibaculum sp.]|uniref:TadE/TadG family type IV pilus assembly protein n=1 Tax=Parvibaculum sp. TaxID=2024848 RepID=UPI002723EC9D|nr:TadE/TadG family type IV pilus assembly protein [Parvibaculum sp.]MDO8839165.1 pilus assembly protein [Parvibaculum sp.]
MQTNEMKMRGLISPLHRFIHDYKGLAAVEFALILPLMIAFYFGGVEMTNMLVANRRVTAVAYTAADLTAQSAALNNSDIADIFAASATILQPFSTAPLKVRISNIVADAQNVAKVAWSDGFQISPRAVGSTVTLPAGLTTPGSSVVFVETTYGYTSPVGEMVAGTVNFSETAYLKPRRAVQISRTN